MPALTMLNKIVKSLAYLRVLFCCSCDPTASDAVAGTDCQTGGKKQSPRITVTVNDPSEVTWHTPTSPTSEKSSRLGDQNQMKVVSQDIGAARILLNKPSQIFVRQDIVVQVWIRIQWTDIVEVDESKPDI